MGQKINPTIFRLKNWNLQCVEKNKEEHNLFNYQNIQIQKYLRQFFSIKGLDIHATKLFYSQKNLYIYITYFSTKEILLFLKKDFKFKTKTYIVETPLSISNKRISYYLLTKKYKTSPKIKRLKILSKFKKYNSNCINSKLVEKNHFLQQILETLTKFLGNYYNIKVILQNYNQGLTINLNEIQKNKFKRKLLLLKQYSKKDFFEEGVFTLFVLIKIKNSSYLLNSFVNKYLTKLKKQNLFLIFLKKALTYLIFLNFSKVEGIKIAINGRFNSAPRSKKKLIIVGNVPTQTVAKNINYSETTAFTKNGTFGIKVWVNYKILNN